LIAVPSLAGINYDLRKERPRAVITFRVWADRQSYRTEMAPADGATEFEQQYPIVISNDGGRKERRLRPVDKTWFEQLNEKAGPPPAVGQNARVRKPTATLAEEPSNDLIAGMPARKFVLNAACDVESDIGGTTVRVHKSRTVQMWLIDLPCAPKPIEQVQRARFGIAQVDELIAAKLATLDGLIVRSVDSTTEQYKGGAPRTFRTTIETSSVRCSALDAALFAIPKDYRYQEPLIGAPGGH
jgi:hypothetical protein